MRLATVSLHHYGPFADLVLALDPRPGRLNVICAPNGAGKSVLRQALADLLFGIGGQTPMAFRFGYGAMRVLAEADFADGSRRTFGRRKGQGNTLIDAEGRLIAPEAVTAAFAGTDRAALCRLFSLDTAALRAGAAELLGSGGQLANALLAARGLPGARALREALRAQAEDIAPQRRVASRPFHAAVDRFTEARKTAEAALLRPEAWERLEQAVFGARETLEAARAEVRARQAAANRLERIRRVRPHLLRRDAATAWLAAHPDAPDLPAALGPRLEAARRDWDLARQLHADEGRRLHEQNAELAALHVDEALLAAAPTIGGLTERAGSVEQALRDIPRRAGEAAELALRVGELVRQLGADLPAGEARRLLRPRAAVAEARRLIAACQAQTQALAKAARDAEGAEAARQRAETALAALPPATETAPLERLLAEIRAAGDPAMRADDAAAAKIAAEAALAEALARVPVSLRDASALAALAPPAEPALRRAHDALTQAETERRRRQDQAQDAATRLRAAQSGLAERRQGDLPDAADVLAARRHRETGYALVARLAFGGAAPSAAEMEVFGGKAPLAAAYPAAVLRADQLADRLAADSARVAEAEAAAQALARAEGEHDEAGKALAGAMAAEAQARASWQALLPPPLPETWRLDDMRAFAATRDLVLERRAALSVAAEAASRLATAHAQWAQALAAALVVPPAPLPRLLAEAEQRLRAAHTLREERARLEAALAAHRQAVATATADCSSAAVAQQLWQEAWEKALAGLGRPAGEAPEVTDAVLPLLEALETTLDRSAETAKRLVEMQEATDSFAAAMAALTSRLTPDAPPDAAPEAALAAVRALAERLAAEQKRLAGRQMLADKAAQTARDEHRLAGELAQRVARLAEVVAACGAADPDAAEARLTLAADRARHALAAAEAEAQLAQDGDGLPLDALRAEVASLAPDDVQPALAEAQAAAGLAQQAAEAGFVALNQHEAELRRLSGEATYADARAVQAEAVATCDRLLREALLYRVAGDLLEQAMAAMAAETGSATLDRIGTWFARLTGCAYRGVTAVPDDNDQPVLVAVPSDHPDELKKVDQLSEGTRDQLFLALRLDAVADHPDALPFIADDILQTFDDARAGAALGALLELSGRQQVIVLTHHRHILELARTLPAGSVHVCALA